MTAQKTLDELRVELREQVEGAGNGLSAAVRVWAPNMVTLLDGFDAYEEALAVAGTKGAANLTAMLAGGAKLHVSSGPQRWTLSLEMPE